VTVVARRERGGPRIRNRWIQSRPEELRLLQPIRCVQPRYAPNADRRDSTRCLRPCYAPSSSRCPSEAGARACDDGQAGPGRLRVQARCRHKHRSPTGAAERRAFLSGSSQSISTKEPRRIASRFHGGPQIVTDWSQLDSLDEDSSATLRPWQRKRFRNTSRTSAEAVKTLSCARMKKPTASSCCIRATIALGSSPSLNCLLRLKSRSKRKCPL